MVTWGAGLSEGSPTFLRERKEGGRGTQQTGREKERGAGAHGETDTQTWASEVGDLGSGNSFPLDLPCFWSDEEVGVVLCSVSLSSVIISSGDFEEPGRACPASLQGLPTQELGVGAVWLCGCVHQEGLG